MKGIFKWRGKKLTAVATALALICTGGVLPENVWHASAETETGEMGEQVPEEGLAIDKSNFPDANFRKFLKRAEYDSNGDGVKDTLCDADDDAVFSKEELSHFTSLDVPGNSEGFQEEDKIESLEGIEKLIYLRIVNVGYHKISGDLDLSDWPKLEYFCCSGNNINSLNLSGQTELDSLACESTSIQTLDLSNMPRLNHLICGNTLLKTIDLSKQKQSVTFACSDNCLTSIVFPKVQDQKNIDYERSISYLQQKEIDFKDEKIFPDFDTARLRGIYVTGAGKEEDRSNDRLEAVQKNDYVLTDLNVGDTVCYTYNCAAKDAESEILLDFAITIGYPEGTLPPGYPNTTAAYDVHFMTQYLREVPLPEGWKWSEEYEENEELPAGNSSFYWVEYTGSDKEYYGEYQRAKVGLYRNRCDHPQEKMTLYTVTGSAITENTTYAKCEECGDYFLNPEENREYSSREVTDIPVVPAVDCTESTEIHVKYGTELKDLDLIHLKKAGYLSDQESAVNVNKLLVENIWYRKDKDSEQVDYSGNIDFTIPFDGAVELTGEEKSLGSLNCDQTLEPGEYTLDLVMNMGKQNIHVQRTIFVDKIDLSKYSDCNLMIKVNEKELSDEPILCDYTREAVKPTVEIIDVDQNESLIWNWHFTYDYINNVDVAEWDQEDAPVIIVRGLGDYYTGELRIPFTIRKRSQPDIPDSTLNTPYASKVVGEVELSGGWEWVSEDREKTLEVGEAVTATAEYTGEDRDLYEKTVQQVTIIRKECEHPEDMWEFRNGVEASTCENGYMGDCFCKQCGEFIGDGDIIYAPHNLKVVEEKAATETASGNIQYYVCQNCGKYFEDEDAEWETTLEKVTIPAEGTPEPTKAPVTTEPAPAPVTPDLPTPGQSMAPEPSRIPAAAAPAQTQTPQWTPMATSKSSQKKPARKGKLITDSQGNRYKVTGSNAKNPTVTFYSPKATAKKVTMSQSVRIDGVRYYITAVRSRAFEGHKKVTYIRIGSRVNTIGDRAFRNCKKLEKLYIQSSKLKPEDIGKRVFENVPKGLKIYVPAKKKDEYRTMFREKGLGKLISVHSI